MTTASQQQLGSRGSLQLEGAVVDEQGDPVSGARVSLDLDQHAMTDHQGRFVFAQLAAGLYRISARKDDLCTNVALVTLHERRGPVVLAMSRGISIRVRVERGESPVVGARLLENHECIATTDGAGLAVLRGVAASFQLFEVDAPGCAPAFLSVWLAPDPGGTVERTVSVERGASIGGVVLGPDDVPVGDATVRLSGAWGGTTTTDARGNWRFDAVAAGTYQIRACSKAFVAVPDLVVDFDGKSGRADLVVRVQRGGRIVGRVVDSAGAVVAGAVAVAFDPHAEHDELHTRVDDQGRFEIALEPGVHDVFAHDVRRASAATRVALADGDVVRLELVVETAAIAGSVIGSNGEPIAGTHVRVDRAPIVCGDITDLHGLFFLGALPPGRYELTADKPDQHERARSPGVQVTAGDVDVKLVPPTSASLRGRVVLDGVPVPYFGVLLTECPQYPSIGRPSGIRDDAGRFDLEGVTPGTWGLVIAGPGTALHTIAPFEVAAGASIDLGDIHLNRGRRITGYVRDASGPVPRARVIVGRRGFDTAERDPLQRWFQSDFETTTRADGWFELDGVSALQQTPICATHEARGTSVAIAVPDGDSTIELALVETGVIEGVLEGFTGTFASVFASRERDGLDVRTARVGPAGTFVFSRLPPGDYTLDMMALPEQPIAPPVRVSVVANERASVRLVMPA